MLRKRWHRSSYRNPGSADDLITLFIDDLPDSMDPKGLHKMCSKFGVVRDVFIPSKRSKAGRRFGFVRFDCEVAANIAIQATNGLWVHDKEFKVKNADFARKVGARLHAPGISGGRHDGSTRQGSGLAVGNQWSMNTQPQHQLRGNSYAEVVRRGRVPVRKGIPSKDLEMNTHGEKVGMQPQILIPTVRVQTVGNGWLHRSAVAVLANHRSTEFMLESFMENSAARLSNGPQSLSAVLGERFGYLATESLCTYGILVHSAALIDEDTAKGARFDVDKVKISTHHISVINQEMKLLVGAKSFVIKIAEEQSVFICNTDFRCSCICHGKEDNESFTSSKNDDDREFERAGSDAISGHEGARYKDFRGPEAIHNEGAIMVTPSQFTNLEGCDEGGYRQEDESGCNSLVQRGRPGGNSVSLILPQPQSTFQGGGLDIRLQGTSKPAGLKAGRPMSIMGSLSDPNGINLEVVLCPKVFLAPITDVCDWQAFGRDRRGDLDLLRHPASGSGLEKEKVQSVQNHAVSAGTMVSGSRSLNYHPEVLIGAPLGNGQGDDFGSRNVGLLRKRGRPPKTRKCDNRNSDSPDSKTETAPPVSAQGLELVFGDVDLPRKRGRPRKKSVIVKALTKVPEKAIPDFIGSCHSKPCTDTVKAERLWCLGKNLGLASPSADADVVKEIVRLLVNDAKRADQAG
ncbi:hypothetical protein Dimus_009739 [Dionaea muscipula]